MLVVGLLVAAAAAVRGIWSPCGLSMLSALNPVSESARGHRFGLTAGWYVSGAVAGGALLGGACALAAGAVSVLPLGPSWRWLAVLVVALAAAASDSMLLPFSLPVHPRQVDERWLARYRRWIYAGGFGLQIGTGFATYVMSGTVYLTAALAVLTAAPRQALLVGLAFGTVRGLAILLVAPVRDAAALRRLLGAVDRLGPASLRASAIGSLAVAAAAFGLAGREHPVVAPVVLVLTGAALACSGWTSRRSSCSVPGRSRGGCTTAGSAASAG